MKLAEYLKTWEGARKENRFLRVVIAMAVITNMFLVMQLANEDTKIILQPPTLVEQAWLTSQKGSKSYRESWALYLALTSGNITPDTVDFVIERIGPLLAPNSYRKVIDLLNEQAAMIKRDGVTMSFEPKRVETEEATNRVFVFGDAEITGSAGNRTREPRTYEYEIIVREYGPLLVHMDVYADKPRTTEYQAKLDAQAKARARREAGSN